MIANKNVDIQFSGITLMRYAQNQKIGKPNNCEVFGSNKTKGSKQDSYNPGADPGGGGRTRRPPPPLKLEKIRFVYVKS